MTVVMNGKGLLLEGQMEDKQVPGVYNFYCLMGFLLFETSLVCAVNHSQFLQPQCLMFPGEYQPIKQSWYDHSC